MSLFHANNLCPYAIKCIYQVQIHVFHKISIKFIQNYQFMLKLQGYNDQKT